GSVCLAAAGLVRRIDADGIITTIAGSGGNESSTVIVEDGMPGLEARLHVRSIAFDPNGVLYLLHQASAGPDNRERTSKLNSDGRLQRVAGCHPNDACNAALDVDALTYRLSLQENAFAIGPSSQLYFGANDQSVTALRRRIHTIDSEGIIRTVFNAGG